jgi:anaerobic magnesium-protoporphyrin IX monomethyl ester cyclase
MKTIIANAPCIIPLPDGKEKFFIRAGSRWPFSIIKERHTPVSDYVPFPFFMAYATALLEQDGIDVSALDAIPLNLSPEQFFSELASHSPQLVVLESTTPTFGADLRLISKIKQELGCRIAVCGSHVTAFPEHVLAHSPDIDFILLGEYEKTLQSLVRALEKKQTTPDLNGLGGIGMRLTTGTYLNKTKAVIQDLDVLPYPAWHQFPSKKRADLNYYWDNICQCKPAAQMHSSRGCPFRCNFCVWISVMYNHSKMRCFSPARTCDEMETLYQQHGIREIYFDDDNFTGNKPHVLALCNEIKRRGIEKTLKWSVMGDTMVCDQEMLAAMADAGCIGMKFGVESGDPDILARMNKPINLTKTKTLATYASKLGIKTHATFSVGLLGETKASMKRTLKYANSIAIDSLQVSIATPFPGTAFYQEAKQSGMLISDCWHDYDGQQGATVCYDSLSPTDIEDFASRFRQRWLRAKIVDPRWIIRQFRILLRIFQYQGVDGLVRMLLSGLSLLCKRRSL